MTPVLNDSLTTPRLGLGDGAGHVETLAHRIAWRYRKSSDPHHSDTYTFNAATLLHFADALLAAERERLRGEVLCHLSRTTMSAYSTQPECKAARDALQRLLDDLA